MWRLVLSILCLPLFLLSQEKVSDIQYNGVYEPTNVGYTVGFASINSTQYLLKENDSLTIFKLENESFMHHSTISNDACKIHIRNTIDPNRSLFEIRDGLYYQFYRDGLQIIDIEAGQVLKSFDFGANDIRYIRPVELHDNRFYFEGLTDRYELYQLDMNTEELTLVEVPIFFHSQIHIGDQIVGLESDDKIHVFYTQSKTDSLVYESDIPIRSIDFSPQDSTFNLMKVDGSFWKMDLELNLTYTGCMLQDISRLKSYKVNGSKLITIHSHSEDGNYFQDRIDIIDLATCQLDITFVTEPILFFADNPRYTISETNDPDYSIFGFVGSNPTDGLNEGLYYIIDHLQNVNTPITEISYIVPHTPFVLNNSLYCIGSNNSFWGELQYILKQNLSTKEVTRLDPNPMHYTESVSLGFPEMEDLICVSNTDMEDPRVWKLDANDNFEDIKSLNFLENLGIGYLDEVMPRSERIYFTTEGGLHSVSESSRTEIAFPKNSNIASYYSTSVWTYYENKIGLVNIEEDLTLFQILDTETGLIDSIIDSDIQASEYSYSAVGPFIFYSEGNGDSQLHFLDLKTKSLHVNNELPYLGSSGVTEGTQRAVYKKSLNSDHEIYEINYNTNEIRRIDIDLGRLVYVVAGYDDAFYFTSREINSDTTKILLLKKNGELSTIYNGPGSFNAQYSSAHDENNPVTVFALFRDGEESIIITNNLQKTRTFTLPNDYSGSFSEIIFNTKDDKFIFKTIDDDGDHYWLYEAYEPLVEIDTPENKFLAYSDLSDSLTLLVYVEDDGAVSFVKYNYLNQQKTEVYNIENTCGYRQVMNGIELNDSEYLLTPRCYVGYEPWILNLQEGSFTLLKDIYPGPLSSSPYDFLKHKNWIYFTAVEKGNNRQWYRIDTGLETNVIEPVKQEVKDLVISPSPTDQYIRLDSDLESLEIYSMSGELIHRLKDYIRNQPIKVISFKKGSYIISAYDKNKNLRTGKFVRI